MLGSIAAIWFGVLAVRAGRNWVLWALTGGLFGLVSSTIVFGLGHATSIPFSDEERTAAHIKWVLVAAGLISVVGGVLTWNVSRKTSGTLPAQPQAPARPVVEKKAEKGAA